MSNNHFLHLTWNKDQDNEFTLFCEVYFVKGEPATNDEPAGEDEIEIQSLKLEKGDLLDMILEEITAIDLDEKITQTINEL